jgi:hypothetical protein
MELFTMGNGLIIDNMEQEKSNGLMVLSMKDNFSMDRRVAMVK